MRIAVVDDDVPQANGVAHLLRVSGYSCQVFHSPRMFVNRIHQESFDLAIFDWMMPEFSGVELLRRVREAKGSEFPVIMLTCRSADQDIVEALNSGADDFIVKPASPDVLIARVRSLLRRVGQFEGNDPFSVGIYHFYPAASTIVFNSSTAVLTNREFALARHFFSNPHRAFSRQYLIERLWGKSPDMQTRTLDTHVARLRSKLDLRPRNGVKFVTLYGYGYRLETVGLDDFQ